MNKSRESYGQINAHQGVDQMYNTSIFRNDLEFTLHHIFVFEFGVQPFASSDRVAGQGRPA